MNTLILLPRNAFRKAVLERDNYKCVFCDDTNNIVAHHIIERRLFENQGYFIDNGASVCQKHHLECEMTTISVEDVRTACGITHKVLPDHLYNDHVYDKWGNVILPNGQRMKGELFSDESVQKILNLGGVLNQFKKYYKYPRTYHLPNSPGVTDDDKVIENFKNFINEEIVILEKMDGENFSLYNDYCHARSIDGRNHWSRDWIKNFHSKIKYDIPDGFRICGENLYATHSITYNTLESYFYGFSIWNEDLCLSWDDTLDYFALLNITPVKVLYRGIFNMQTLLDVQSKLNFLEQEGYVLRKTKSFKLIHFKDNVGKFVRKNHIQTKTHWMYDRIEQNTLKV